MSADQRAHFPFSGGGRGRRTTSRRRSSRGSGWPALLTLATLGVVGSLAVAAVDAGARTTPAPEVESPALVPTSLTLPPLTVATTSVTVPPLTVATTNPPATVVATAGAEVGTTVAATVGVTVVANPAVSSTTVASVDEEEDLCLLAGLEGAALVQCREEAGDAVGAEIDLCEAAGLTGDELEQCREGAGPPLAELCVDAGLTGAALEQCQADTGGDTVIDLDLCLAAGLSGDELEQCRDGAGGPPLAELCAIAGLTGAALDDCVSGGGPGGGGGSVIEIDLCLAAGLSGEALTQCREGTGGQSLEDLCAAAGLTGAALAQCLADTGGDFTIELNLCLIGGPAAAASSQCAPTGDDLRTGAVFTLSNDPAGNQVEAFFRMPDGTLNPAGSFPTDGLGSGGFEDSSHAVVVRSPLTVDDPTLLLAVNPGSDDISVFRVEADALELIDLEPSNGQKPVSVAIHDRLVYVLNNEESTDGTSDALNCREGEHPAVTGFRMDDGGDLTPIPESTRPLSGGADSGCAQLSFSPDGTALLVSQRTAAVPDQPAGDDGAIDTFVVNEDGTLGEAQTFAATGQGPLGFAFTDDGLLLTAEQSGGPYGPTLGAAAAYRIDPGGQLTATGPSVGNGGTGTGWVDVNGAGTLAFTSSFFGDGRLSSYTVDPDGVLTLLQADADPEVTAGANELSFGRDERSLYLLNSLDGTISVFAVGEDGTVSRIDTEAAHEPDPTGAAIGLATI